MADAVRISFERKLCTHLLGGSTHLLGGSENMVISPYSAGVCVGMVLAGAGNATLDEMCSALGLAREFEEPFMLQHKTTCEFLTEEHAGVELVVCNSLWADGRVEAAYKATCMDSFHAEVLALAKKETINAWIAQKTKDHIPALLTEQVHGPSVVVNAVWFKGTFHTKFDQKDTQPRAFYPQHQHARPGDRVMVPTMQKLEEVQYAEHSAGQVVELPYGDGPFALLVILPAPKIGCAQAVEEIIGEDWESVRAHMTPTLVDLQLPKCSLKYGLSLKPTLQFMGMQQVFSPAEACLDRLTKAADGAYITDVLQAATIDVTEVGVEAAAATAAPSGTRGSGGRHSPAPIEVFVDRPYVLMVVERELDVILFAAVVTNPAVDAV